MFCRCTGIRLQSSNGIYGTTSGMTGTEKQIEVGMGATGFYPPNCHPYTIIKIVNEKRIVLQQDIANRIDKNGNGPGPQVYEYYPNPSGSTIDISLRKNGRWVPVGQLMDCGTRYYLGKRRKFSQRRGR